MNAKFESNSEHRQEYIYGTSGSNGSRNLKGYPLGGRPPLLGRGLCRGGMLHSSAPLPILLVVFRFCFFFGFPLTCVETGWLLEVGFHVAFRF